jgi:exodeoxyribonuclease VII large subunit
MPISSEIFTLKQVANSIQNTIKSRFNRLYWVKAEVHRFNLTKSHCYPELVYKEHGKVIVEMKAICWASNFTRISELFFKTVKEPLRDGLTLLLQVKIVYNPLYGLSLEIQDIDPTFSIGELEKERKETLKRLHEEGILGANQQLEFPLLPKRIAIISVSSSKGLSDFFSVINDNLWNEALRLSYAPFFMVFEANLNGDLAINSIINQLASIEKVRHHFDLVAIIRGGGGEIGLACYNNYALAKAIATFPIPIITGIGHSTNTTVSEMVSYRNAITPTELGDFIIKAYNAFSFGLFEAQRTIKSEAVMLIDKEKKDLNAELRVYKSETTGSLFKFKARLKQTATSLIQHSLTQFNSNKSEQNKAIECLRNGVKLINQHELITIANTTFNLNKESKNLLHRERKIIGDVFFYIHQQSPKRIESELLKLTQFERFMNAVDPQQVLKRGYSITLVNGKILSPQNLPDLNIEIETISEEYSIKSTINAIKKRTHE